MPLRLLIIGLFLSSVATAQTTTQLMNSDGKMIGAIGDINGAIVPTFRSDGIDGHAYLAEEWNRGTVYFTNGKHADSLWLQFDLVTNAVYFKREGVMQAFLEEVAAFTFYPLPGTDTELKVFGRGYPPYGDHRASTFYQVLEEGNNFHLLNYRHKRIAETYLYNLPTKRSYQSDDVLFLYTVKTGEMNKVNLKKKAILKLLPAFATMIESFCTINNWDLDTEDELSALINKLNSLKIN